MISFLCESKVDWSLVSGHGSAGVRILDTYCLQDTSITYGWALFVLADGVGINPQQSAGKFCVL